MDSCVASRHFYIAPSATHHPALRATFLQRKAKAEAASPHFIKNRAERTPVKPSLLEEGASGGGG